MSPVIFSLWGPLAIHAYGACIALGVIIGFFLLTRDAKLQKILSADALVTTLQLMIFFGFLGGRAIFLLVEATSIFDCMMFIQFWKPGFSVLGSILGITLSLGLYLKMKKIPVLNYLDRIAIYAPLVQSFGRLGCFFAGCCYGVHSNVWWSVTYTNFEHMAPLYISLHPSQLYSSVVLFLIFLFLYFVMQKMSKVPGILLCIYLFLVGMERFLIDFVRADRIFLNNEVLSYLSIHQWIALGVALSAIVGLFVLSQQSKKAYGFV